MIVGENIKVKFYHDTKNNHVDLKKAKRELSVKAFKEYKNSIERCSTAVQIFRDDELVSSAKVWCSLEDNYSRVSGRYLATKKASLHYSVTDEEGEQIMNTLLELPSSKRNLISLD